jgi:hypothetical protein
LQLLLTPSTADLLLPMPSPVAMLLLTSSLKLCAQISFVIG